MTSEVVWGRLRSENSKAIASGLRIHDGFGSEIEDKL